LAGRAAKARSATRNQAERHRIARKVAQARWKRQKGD